MKPSKLQTLSADWIIPVKGDPIPGGCVVCDAHSVLFVGTVSDATSLYPETQVIRHSGKVILPGLVNAHCHLNHSCLNGRIPMEATDTFFDWIEKVIAEQVSDSEKDTAAQEGVSQLTGSGTAAVGDIVTDDFTVPLLEKSGLSGVFFHETVGFNPEEADKIYAEKLMLIAGLQKSAAFQHFIAPHSAYSVSRPLLEKIAQTGMPTSFHLAESKDESVFLKKGHPKMEKILTSLGKWDPHWKPPGLSPVQYFHETGLLHEKSLAVHMVWVEEKDYPFLEKTKPNICLCPRSNHRLNNGYPPVKDYLGMGLNLCLGTDGLGSNEDLSILNEMKYLKKILPDLEEQKIVRMGTLGGALALNLENRLGTIEAGKMKNFAIVDNGNSAHPYSFLD